MWLLSYATREQTIKVSCTVLKKSLLKKTIQKMQQQKSVFYDPPHLLKNVRNNLKKGDLQFDGEKVCRKYIVDFFKFDKSQPIWMVPKLKEKHIELPPFQAMCVNLAAQVLSHSVAAGISTLVTLKYLPEQAVKTATFVDHFGALFNTFNSKSLKSIQQMGHAFQQLSSHHAFLENSLNVLSKIQTLDGCELPCITGWKICIDALFQLWEYLSKEAEFKFFLTNCLNQDCMENLFSIIHYKGGFRNNPDCEQFWDTFCYVIAENFFVHSEKANCKIDTEHILLNIANVVITE